MKTLMASVLAASVLAATVSAQAFPACPPAGPAPCRTVDAFWTLPLGSDAIVGSTVTIIANSVYAGRGVRPHPVWLGFTIGYSVYAAALGTALIATELADRANFPMWQGENFRLGWGIGLVGVSAINIGVGVIANMQPRARQTPLVNVTPWIDPGSATTPSSAGVIVGGRF